MAVVYESAGVTEINRSARVGLRMNDDGVMVRSAFHRAQKFAWRDVSGFADGVMIVGASRGVPSAPWVLHVELTDGQVIPVDVTSGWRPDEHLEIMAAVRRAAARHGVPAAELTGLSVVGGKYEYPDDLLLPRLAGDLSAAARLLKVRSAVSGSAAALLLAGALVVGLWWDPTRHSNYLLGFLIGALVAVTFALISWAQRSDYLKLEQAAFGGNSERLLLMRRLPRPRSSLWLGARTT